MLHLGYMRSKRIQLGIVVVLLGVLGAVVLKQQAIADWWRLRGYTAPSAVATLASEDTMTDQARHLLYVNRPLITTGTTFTSHCPSGTEKTVVLGCYVGNDLGIYIYQVSDARLNGVEQVTAAHEMLHAAYRRLSSAERSRVDSMLMDYYQHDLTDERIKSTIEAYKKSEPHDVVNEMHSVFGTEVAQLPAPLESYYQQYFTDRSKVAAFTASYEGEFTDRRAKVAAYDAQLKELKSQIDEDEAQLAAQKQALDSEARQLNAERSGGNVSKYNGDVPAYNRSVDAYNNLLAATKNLIQQYNDIVDARNAVALEEQQLTQALSANALPGQ